MSIASETKKANQMKDLVDNLRQVAEPVGIRDLQFSVNTLQCKSVDFQPFH